MATAIHPSTRAAGPAPRSLPLWRNLSFTLMWTSTAASGFGDRMIMLAALALIGGMAPGVESTSMQAATQFFFFAAYIVFSIPGGWLADRLPRKWVMLGCDESRGALLLLSMLMVGEAAGQADIAPEYHWRVYAVLFAVGTFAAIFNPSRNAIVPQIVPPGQFQPANAIILGINVIASMIGLIVGGWIIEVDNAGSVGTGLMVGALFYMVSGTFFAFLRPRAHYREPGAGLVSPPGDAAPERADERAPIAPPSAARRRATGHFDGLRYVLDHRRIVALVLLTVLVWSSAAAVSSGLMGLGKMHFGLEDQALLTYFTQASASIGLGMLLGAGVISAIRTRRESKVVLSAAIAMTGVSVILLALAPTPVLSCLCALGVGLFGNVAIVSIMTILQTISANYIRGRVMGLTAWCNTLFSTLTYFVLWRLPDADQVIVWVMLAIGPVMLLAGLVGLWKTLTVGPTPDRGLNAIWHLNRLYCFGWHNVRHVGREHLTTFPQDATDDDPRRRPLLLAPNHTTGIDGFVIQAGWSRIVRWVMLKSYLFWYADPLWRRIRPIALDQHENGNAKGDLANLKRMVAELKEGQPVGIFPEGGLQRDVRELKELREGVGFVARRAGAKIIPVWIHGTPRVKSMLLHFLLPSNTVIVFGEPFTPDRKDKDEDIVEELRQRLITLGRRFEDEEA